MSSEPTEVDGADYVYACGCYWFCGNVVACQRHRPCAAVGDQRAQTLDERLGDLIGMCRRDEQKEPRIAYAPAFVRQHLEHLLSALSSSRSREQALREKLEQMRQGWSDSADWEAEQGSIHQGQIYDQCSGEVAKLIREIWEAPRAGEEEPS